MLVSYEPTPAGASDVHCTASTALLNAVFTMRPPVIRNDVVKSSGALIASRAVPRRERFARLIAAHSGAASIDLHSWISKDGVQEGLPYGFLMCTCRANGSILLEG